MNFFKAKSKIDSIINVFLNENQNLHEFKIKSWNICLEFKDNTFAIVLNSQENNQATIIIYEKHINFYVHEEIDMDVILKFNELGKEIQKILLQDY